MLLFLKLTMALCLLLTAWSVSIQRSGWLDRVVAFYKHEFLNDMNSVLPPIKFKVTLLRTPLGYKDSPKWDLPSAVRLLEIIRQSDSAVPVRRALRRALRGTRRMSYAQSHKYFPSLMGNQSNDFYYDVDSKQFIEQMTSDDDMDAGIIVVSNPVEARLPSARISIQLLRDILETRALAAREMPTTVVIPWWLNITVSSGGGDQQGGDDGQDGGDTKSTDTATEAGATVAGDNSTSDNSTSGITNTSAGTT